MAQQSIDVRQTCRQAMALSRPCILAGTERANLHLGRTFDVEAEYVDADCYIHLSKPLAAGQAIRCLWPHSLRCRTTLDCL